MIFSHTQISNFLRCPRSYRYRYLEGWREKETRAAMIFGRCFEKALQAYFCGDDCGATLYREWGAYRDTPFQYKKGETWDRLVHQGVHLLERFAQDNRIHIPQPQQNLQLKVMRELPNANQFIAYVDAIGELDGLRCLMDWKTTTSRYSEEPAGLLSLDPQLICYSWITGVSEVALVVFVRKHQPERFSETSFAGAGRVVSAGVTPGVRGGSAEAGECGLGWEQGEGQREQAQGDELWADGGDREAAAGGSS